jgi:hypothetical protein
MRIRPDSQEGKLTVPVATAELEGISTVEVTAFALM